MDALVSLILTPKEHVHLKIIVKFVKIKKRILRCFSKMFCLLACYL